MLGVLKDGKKYVWGESRKNEACVHVEGEQYTVQENAVGFLAQSQVEGILQTERCCS